MAFWAVIDRQLVVPTVLNKSWTQLIQIGHIRASQKLGEILRKCPKRFVPNLTNLTAPSHERCRLHSVIERL
jgi:hypothetical protein